MSVINKENAPHYSWGEACDGWVLSPSSDLLVIQERMPPGTAEQRHLHSKARQFFYVLKGELTMEIDGAAHVLSPMSGIEVPPGAPHQARNIGNAETHFLVISTPSTRGDRIEVG